MKILVTGATGAQGCAVVRALVAAGVMPRALVRDPGSAGAMALADEGAELAVGRFEDVASLERALVGVQGVFSVQLYNPRDVSMEPRQAQALIDAARAAGVGTFVQSSVSGTGGCGTMPGWEEGRWDRHYWQNKAAIEEAVMVAGFAAPVVLRPAFMMENFIAPKSAWMFPDLADGHLMTAVVPDASLALVATQDIAAAALSAFREPERFAKARIELAGDRLTLPQIARVLTGVWGRTIDAVTLAPAEVVARGQNPGWVQTQEWINRVGYSARPETMIEWGLTPTLLADWAKANGR
ncbi:NmrA family NAD(P)-binding protein [Brevundimonas sp.]|uniref:NmrA family NAD(P)-binding protein n=1 Tax=Brevundimonas sp. TaxID=1871086 RepID=UPI002AB80BD2|nr:NmrA family NAD(P)-binding protein [Brevundimonas sp.]MDZ4363304.1 NmrA family NAD(P)-binding protein [Brevundimonas sp.]